jgi:hypothetical protein
VRYCTRLAASPIDSAAGNVELPIGRVFLNEYFLRSGTAVLTDRADNNAAATDAAPGGGEKEPGHDFGNDQLASQRRDLRNRRGLSGQSSVHDGLSGDHVIPPPVQTYAMPKPDNRTPTPDKFKADVDPPEPAQAPKYVGR